MMKVFIADDSKLIRERIIHMISGVGGVEIAGQAQNGFEATEQIRKLKPDAVILNVRMPGKNGIDTLQEIKKHNSVPLIIMFTNYPYPQYRKKCMKAGAAYPPLYLFHECPLKYHFLPYYDYIPVPEAVNKYSDRSLSLY